MADLHLPSLSPLIDCRHSRLSGSGDLDRWALAGVEAVQGAWRDHIIGPLAGVRDELFNTFRARPTIVSMYDYEADRDSLARMLDEFQVGGWAGGDVRWMGE